MDNNQLRRLTEAEEALVEQAPEKLPDLDIKVVYHQPYFNEHGERCERVLPATFDESTPWKPMGSGKRRMRVRYPLEDSAGHGDGGVLDLPPEADHGIMRDKEVTGD